MNTEQKYFAANLEMSKTFPTFVVPNRLRLLSSDYILFRIKAGFLFGRFYSGSLGGLATFKKSLASLYLYLTNKFFVPMPNRTKNLKADANVASASTSSAPRQRAMCAIAPIPIINKSNI